MTPALVGYNKNRKECPDEWRLCQWDFCQSCIDARIRSRSKIPELKSHPEHKTYFRYWNPEHRIERKKIRRKMTGVE